MSPLARKALYAISFETLGIAVAALVLSVLSSAPPDLTLPLSVLSAAIALAWNATFNALFEAWEARQPLRGRPLRLRVLHALLFEGGLTLLTVPIMAWWLSVSLWQAFLYEAALIVLFLVYTYAFTWAFDRLFGLPKSAL